MVTLAVIGFCVLLFALAFVAPRLSHRAERGGAKPLAAGQRAAGAAPGLLGRILQKPFGKGRQAVHASGRHGRRARSKAPF